MKRKVVKHGPSTLIISIPSSWARKYGVKQGDELDVEEQGSRLVIDNNKNVKLPEVDINITGLKRKIINRLLVNSYHLGYDLINISHSNPKQQLYIQHKLPELLGYEIIERTNEGCVVKNIAAKMDIDFQKSIKKIFLLTQGMINDLYEAYKNDNKKDLANVHYRDVDINKYSNFCLRTINKGLYTGYPELATHILYHLIISLENLADDYKRLAKLLVNFPKDKNVLNVILKTKDYFELSYDFFYKPDRNKIIKAMQADYYVHKAIRDSFRGSKSVKKLLMLTLLNNITRMTYHLISRRLSIKF